ncbi:hypothetical protein [Leifsonia poae]|uniref:hypothetical protein n=1 Tax=Leifsonia poae TaxID=110933 RepID=UPI001CBDBEDC|nr:hypothetical protein [Leifsonia poae]
MNTTTNSENTPPVYWFGAIERSLRERMRSDLADLGLRRGSWRILHTLAGGPATAEAIATTLPPVGEGRRSRGEHPRGGRRPGHDHGRFGGSFEGHFGTEEERRAFHDGRRAAFHERFPSEEERHAFHAGRRAGHGFGRGRGFGPGRGFGRPDVGNDEEREAFFEKLREKHGLAPCADAEERHAFFADRREAREASFAETRGDRRAGNRRGGDRRGERIDSVLSDFAERGWVTIVDGVAELTPAGREAHDAAFARVRELRGSAAAGISGEDYASLLSTLETMARNLGWKAADAVPDSESDSESESEKNGESGEEASGQDDRDDRDVRDARN